MGHLSACLQALDTLDTKEEVHGALQSLVDPFHTKLHIFENFEVQFRVCKKSSRTGLNRTLTSLPRGCGRSKRATLVF
jgi:hypothetical protein